MLPTSFRSGRAVTACSVTWLVVSTLGGGVSAQEGGASLYQQACAACHGTDGRGMSQDVVGFDVPLGQHFESAMTLQLRVSDEDAGRAMLATVEPLVLVTAPLILLAASLLASYIPSIRATKVDPTVALRAE